MKITLDPDIAFTIKRASGADAVAIADLYNRVYRGTYTDPLMESPELIRQALMLKEFYWILASHESQVVASVVYRYDSANALAKVYGAVVQDDFRGQHLAEQMMSFGYSSLLQAQPPVQVVYAVTRTVSVAPQILTANLGYKKLGIFPNVHKTDSYETHVLTALFTKKALHARFTGFKLHPKVAGVYDIARKECGLPKLPLAKVKKRTAKNLAKVPLGLEVIHAPHFVRQRFHSELKNKRHQNWFFPFHEPNLLLTSPDQKTEIFCYLSQVDKHCVLIAVRDEKARGLGGILNQASQVLHDIGARYVELILPADEVEKIETVIEAEFIPCAYIPAMTKRGNKRCDFVACSRSFEVLNFRHSELDGVNRKYLLQYFDLWKEISLGLEKKYKK